MAAETSHEFIPVVNVTPGSESGPSSRFASSWTPWASTNASTSASAAARDPEPAGRLRLATHGQCPRKRGLGHSA